MNTQDLKSGITDAMPGSLQDGLDRAGSAVGDVADDLVSKLGSNVDLDKAQQSVTAAAAAAGEVARKRPALAIVGGAVLAALAAVLLWRRLS